jgi:DeoR/GlpR family transcriptional regulator of sugar metabolism
MRKPVENLNEDTAISRKRMFNFKEKERIGAEAVKLIKDGDFIMLDSGTTTLEIARNLGRFQHLRILTNAMNIATELMSYKRFDVVLLGGNVRVNSLSVVGPLALSVLRNFRGYKLFLGVDSFSLDNGVSTPNMEEALLNQMMIQQADRVIAVFDSSKFNKRSFVHIADARELDCIVTDRAMPNGMGAKLRALGIELRVV